MCANASSIARDVSGDNCVGDPANGVQHSVLWDMPSALRCIDGEGSADQLFCGDVAIDCGMAACLSIVSSVIGETKYCDDEDDSEPGGSAKSVADDRLPTAAADAAKVMPCC